MNDWRDVTVEVDEALHFCRTRVRSVWLDSAAAGELATMETTTTEVKQIAGMDSGHQAAEYLRRKIELCATPKVWRSRCHVLARLDSQGRLQFIAQRRKSKRGKIKCEANRHMRDVAARARKAAAKVRVHHYVSIAWWPQSNLLESSRILTPRELSQVMRMLAAVPERTRVFKMVDYHQHVHGWQVFPSHYPVPIWLLEELLERVEKENQPVFVATDNPRLVLCKMDEYCKLHDMQRQRGPQ